MNPFRKAHETTIKAADDIREIVSDTTVGWANETAKQQIRARIFSVQCTATDPYIREMAAHIESWADILFSARKWQKHGGTDCVQRCLLSDCANMASRAETLLNETDQEV